MVACTAHTVYFAALHRGGCLRLQPIMCMTSDPCVRTCLHRTAVSALLHAYVNCLLLDQQTGLHRLRSKLEQLVVLLTRRFGGQGVMDLGQFLFDTKHGQLGFIRSPANEDARLRQRAAACPATLPCSTPS